MITEEHRKLLESLRCDTGGKATEDYNLSLLADFERTVRLECINAMCNRCKGGEVPERIYKNAYIENFDAVARGDWVHRETRDYNACYCGADKIHEAVFTLAGAASKA